MNATWFRGPVAWAISAAALLIVALSCFVVIPETEQAVILRMQTPLVTINGYQKGEQFGRTGAGVVFRIPFIDQVMRIDKRVLDIELQNQPVLSTDQLRLEVDAYARFRVVDPLLMVKSAGTVQRVTDQLTPLFASALRNELGKRPFASLLSPERGQVMDNIQAALQKLASQYGVEIVDVRIKHADLPSGSPLDSAYARMRTARQQEAATIRAQGQKEATIIRANASAQAAQIQAASFGKDPEFYNFFRGMKSYQNAFLYQGQDKGETSIILSPENSYLQQFRNPK
ncbi:protease modulator HflC [Sphingomonas sp. LB-2]|uniref:protease modulator HflC n=1 Tax=Sphingomonas caeni TaxID=2984949 RepID=UPI002230ABA2|nr:protease modulator HflC [Sphingomonas caeni]MCW3847176.1 protease modulator HflC [Sphingomonas caeni]